MLLDAVDSSSPKLVGVKVDRLLERHLPPTAIGHSQFGTEPTCGIDPGRPGDEAMRHVLAVDTDHDLRTRRWVGRPLLLMTTDVPVALGVRHDDVGIGVCGVELAAAVAEQVTGGEVDEQCPACRQTDVGEGDRVEGGSFGPTCHRPGTRRSLVKLETEGCRMSDVPQNPDWRQGTDGKWYAPQRPAPPLMPPSPIYVQPGSADHTTEMPAALPLPPARPPPPVMPTAFFPSPESPQHRPDNRWSLHPLAVGGALLAALILGILIGVGIGSSSTRDKELTTSAPQGTSTAAPTTTVAPTTNAAPTTTATPRACKDTPAGEKLDTKNVTLYPGRPDSQAANDHEAAVGDCVRISGETAYLLSAGHQTVLGTSVLMVTVKIENRDAKANSYNLFDWRVQTPGGQVLDASFYSGDSPLGSGDLVQGGSVTGTVSFEVPPGDNYLIWKPNAFEAARGIWKVTD